MSIAEPQPTPLHPGFRLGRYELLCPVAQGGMAAVWLARLHGAHGFEKLVAVKTILAEHSADERFQAMFLDEAKLASMIAHVNVVHILDLGEEQGVLFLAMEWIDGDSLSRLHRAIGKAGKDLPLGFVLRVMADVCSGLHAAHELKDARGVPLGVVHRDVSPHNIIVNDQGVAKLIDFGIAKARDRLAGETNAGLIKGKLQYMPPEQAIGKALDRRADVFAVGATLYYLLANRPAYDGPNQMATLHALTSGKPPLPLPNRVPAAVERVVMKALAYKPEDRYDNAADLHAALEEAMRTTECRTTSSDVARILAENFGDRIANRRKAVEAALAAAGDRQKLEQLLRPPAEGTSSVLVGGAYLRVLSPGSFSGERRDTGSFPAARRETGRQSRASSVRDEREIPTLAEQAAAASEPTSRAAPEIDLDKSARVSQGALANEIELEGSSSTSGTQTYVFEDLAKAPIGSNLRHLVERPGGATDGASVRDVARAPSSRRSDGPGIGRFVAIGAAIVVLAGAALEVTSHGAFFRNDVADKLNAGDHEKLARDTAAKVRAAFADDTFDRAAAALSSVDDAVARASRYKPLLALASYAHFAHEARFGRDIERHAKASALLDKAGDAPGHKLAAAMRDVAVGEPAKARPALNAVLKTDAKNVDVLLAMGELELAAKQPKEALPWLEKAVAAENSPRTVFALVRALEAIEPERARKEAKALATNSSHVGSRIVLARLSLLRDRDLAATDDWLAQLAKLDAASGPYDKAEIATLRGLVALERGDTVAARKAFDETVAHGKGRTSAWTELGLGDVDLAEKAWGSAITHYKSALELDDTLWRAHIGIARAQIGLGNHEGAKLTLAAIKDPAAAAEVAKWSDVAEGKNLPKPPLPPKK